MPGVASALMLDRRLKDVPKFPRREEVADLLDLGIGTRDRPMSIDENTTPGTRNAIYADDGTYAVRQRTRYIISWDASPASFVGIVGHRC
jgi:hypothetical protein